MSTITKIGVNLTKLQNLTAPDFNLSSDPKELIRQLPERVNEITNNYYGIGILTALFIMLFYTLGDRSPLGNFGYSNLRAFSLSGGIASIFGVIMIQTGLIYSFKSVAFFIFITMVGLIMVALTEHKQ